MTVLLDGAHGASQDDEILNIGIGHGDSGEDPEIADKYFGMSPPKRQIAPYIFSPSPVSRRGTLE